MEQKKNEFLDSKAKLRNYENAAKTYLKYYRLKRSVEFLKQADKEEAWKRIQRKRAQRTFRRQVQTLGKVAAAMAACFALTYFATHYGEVKVEKEANKELRAEYSFPETGGKKALLKTDNGEVIDLTTQNGTIRTSEHTVAVSKAGESLSYAEGGKPAEKQGQPSKAEVHYNTLQVCAAVNTSWCLKTGLKFGSMPKVVCAILPPSPKGVK